MKELWLSIEIFIWMKDPLNSRKQIGTYSNRANYNRVLFLTRKNGKDENQWPGELRTQKNSD